MVTLISRHRVFAVYLLSLLWLVVAMLVYSVLVKRSPDYVLNVAGVAAGATVVYAAILKAVGWLCPRWTADLPEAPAAKISPGLHTLLTLMVGLYGFIVCLHFLILGNVPLLEALGTYTDIGVSVVRQQGYFGLPGLMRYASDYSVKALGPALLLLTYYFRSRLFWVVLAIGLVYSLGLFARILPVILLLPLLVYLLTLRRWLQLAGAVVILVVMVAAVTIASSVALRESTLQGLESDELMGAITTDSSTARHESEPHEATLHESELRESARHESALRRKEGDWHQNSAIYALFQRALVVPGQVIYQWFDYYDEPARRERGCGYRLLAPLIGCSYEPVPSKLYPAFYRENYDLGMRGSLNAASFMTEFANFGPGGFLLSALMAGFLFAAVRLIYRNHPLALPMNLPLIVTAMESSMVTVINSGSGWLVMTVIFLIFFPVRHK